MPSTAPKDLNTAIIQREAQAIAERAQRIPSLFPRAARIRTRAPCRRSGQKWDKFEQLAKQLEHRGRVARRRAARARTSNVREGEEDVRHLQGLPRSVPQAEGEEASAMHAAPSQSTHTARCVEPRAVLLRVCASAVAARAGAAGHRPERPRSRRIGSRPRLDPDARSRQRHGAWCAGAIRRATPADELYIHLYLNAFANNRTTLMTGMREAERLLAAPSRRLGAHRPRGDPHRRARTSPRSSSSSSPDDGNPNDHTLARLPLPRAGAPGRDARGALRLRRPLCRACSCAPATRRRSSSSPSGFPSWRCSRTAAGTRTSTTPTSEFFADFGTYDVDAHRARRLRRRLHRRGARRARQRRRHQDAQRARRGRARLRLDGRSALPRRRGAHRRRARAPARAAARSRARRRAICGALRAAMTRYARWFGPYPYPVLTVVDPGPGGLGAGGMEYPMLITVGTAWWMPAGLRLPEMVTVHEFGHQYWYGMVANDEVDEAWLDEGINSYVEGADHGRDLRRRPQLRRPVRPQRRTRWHSMRLRYLAAGSWDPIDNAVASACSTATATSTVYAKAALALRTLDGWLGDDRLRDALRDYYATGASAIRPAATSARAGRRAGRRSCRPLFSQLLRRHRRARLRRRARRRARVPPLRPAPRRGTAGRAWAGGATRYRSRGGRRAARRGAHAGRHRRHLRRRQRDARDVGRARPLVPHRHHQHAPGGVRRRRSGRQAAARRRTGSTTRACARPARAASSASPAAGGSGCRACCTS